MKILVTGASGLVGTALVPFLKEKGHEVKRAVRQHEKESSDSIFWDPGLFNCNNADFEGFDAVINLSGENLFSTFRWNEEKKQRIVDSRVKATQSLSTCFDGLEHPPKILLNASAVGFYGNRGDEILTEESSSGTGFLPDVCRKWETATEKAKQLGIRVVLLRFGIILTPVGAALGKMLTPFKLGLGGILGSGKQYMSWIALDDLLNVISHLLVHDSLQGPVNVDTPYPVTNEEFTKIFGKILNRPTALPLPAFLTRLIFGEMADEVLLSSTRAMPTRLLNSGFIFQYPELESALCHLLNREG